MMRLKYRRAYAAVLCFLLLLTGWVQEAFAQGTTTIHVTGDNHQVGDTVSVRVQATESGAVTVKFDASVLEFQSCDVQGYETSDNTVTYTGRAANLQFIAMSAGTSPVIVSSDTLKGSSVSLRVGGGTSTEPPQQPAAQPSAASGQFEIDGTAYVVSERYANNEIPSGFQKTQISIGESTYNELSNGTETLLYLKPASDTSGKGKFYWYQEATAQVTPMVLFGTVDDYVMTLPGGDLPTASWVSVTLDIDGRQTPFYAAGEQAQEFCFFYGMDEKGTRQWYQYDTVEGDVQRLNPLLLSQQADGDGEEKVIDTPREPSEKKSNLRYIVAVLIFIIVVLAIILVNLLLSRRHDGFEDYDDGEDIYDEEEDPDDGEDVYDEEEDPDDGEDVYDEEEDPDDSDDVYDEEEDSDDEEEPDDGGVMDDGPELNQRQREIQREFAAKRNAVAGQPKGRSSVEVPEIEIMDLNDL